MDKQKIINYLQYVKYSPLPVITKPVYQGIGVILLFHNVSPFSKSFYLKSGFYQRNITPEKLEETIKYFLRNKYRFLSLDEMLDTIPEKKSNKKFVVMTLDDGMLDNCQYAYPIFKKYEIPFGIYLPVRFIENGEILWPILLEKFILERNEIELTDTFGSGISDLSTKAKKELAFQKLLKICEHSNEAHILSELFKYNKWTNYNDNTRYYMNWNEVREMSGNRLCTFGSHTVNHIMLSKISDSELEYELTESKNIIENMIQKPVCHLAYPFGTPIAVGEREIEFAGICGYKTAVTVRYANIHNEHAEHLLSLPRYTMKQYFNDNILDLITSGTFQFLLKKGKRLII
ncbi:MAG: hypothetical protein QG635_2392 [Bacteroidota bacterium]|nr:hypothetical protein [Bacteroidota bacterium]